MLPESAAKKDILNLLSDKKNELNNFFKSEKPGTKSVDDLVKIITYYNAFNSDLRFTSSSLVLLHAGF